MSINNTKDQPVNQSVEEIDRVDEDREREYAYYTYLGNENYLPINHVQRVDTLPTGLYSFVWKSEHNSWAFKKHELNTDNLYNLPIPQLENIKSDISKFWIKEKKFKEYGLLHKRGILLYGQPGCGKSGAIQLLINELIANHNGLIFKISDRETLDIFTDNFNSILRVIEPRRKVITIIEDIDGLFEEGASTQTRLLNLLDGINQSNNIVYVATTNYPEKLEKRILNRPSRFDKRYEFGLPESNIRKFYIKKSLKPKDLKNIDIDYWIDKTEGLTLAHLRELVVSVIILENDFEEEIDVLKNMKKQISSIKSIKPGFGISQDN